MDDLIGTFLHLQRMSTEDGPGIRTTVFLKGCLLRCSWCHNPESLISDPQVQRVETNCLGCGSCLEACPQGCIKLGSDFIIIGHETCDGCGLCVDACPAGAMELLGKRISVSDLFDELVKDLSFFQQSGGGVTLSGGEPTLQSDFCAALMARLQESGIHTALDTCGMTSWKNLEKILPHTNLVLYDLKEIDPDRHEVFTGYTNRAVLSNLLRLYEFIKTQGGKIHLWVRTPLIPGKTATKENLEGIGSYLASQLDGTVERWELPAFNNLCRDKYRRLGMDWDFESTPLLSEGEIEEYEIWAKEAGLPEERVMVTGATRVV